MSITKALFGKVPDTNKEVYIFTLTNKNGLSVQILSLGGIVYTLNVPDKHGTIKNISANLSTVEEYLTISHCFGAIIGRFANRIANGKFAIDRKTFDLSSQLNDNGQLLHGGKNGFQYSHFDVEIISDGLKLSLVSPESHQGFPGTLKAEIIYKLTDENSLDIFYSATCDKSTPVSLTNHTYFNLSGFETNVLKTIIQINSNKYLPVDEKLIPTGELADVGIDFDFRQPKPIGKNRGGNFDHNFCLKDSSYCARAVDPLSGRILEVFTTEPGLQFYTAPNLELRSKKGDLLYGNFSAFCFETQKYPDSPNHPHFPNSILRPGEVYTSKTTFKFSVEK
jgi:aldose 1-epimerase